MTGARTSDAWQMLLGVGHAAGRFQGVTGRPTPFTLLSGFLGSGKTTLLKALLEQASPHRIVALVNDFGAVNVDAALIRRRTPAAIELSNGCACCSLAAGLAQTLADLLSGPERPDAIVMEASGVAEPLGILHVALSHPAVGLNGVITLVDAERLSGHLADPSVSPLLGAQAAAADLILLNKADLPSPESVREARRQVARLAPGVRILETTHANVPPDIIHGLALEARARGRAPDPSHRAAFRAWRFATTRLLDEQALCAVAGALPASIYRAKGFVRTVRQPGRLHLLQVVGGRWSLTPDEDGADTPGASEIVFIGLADDRELATLQARLEACEAGG